LNKNYGSKNNKAVPNKSVDVRAKNPTKKVNRKLNPLLPFIFLLLPYALPFANRRVFQISRADVFGTRANGFADDSYFQTR
jgi:hypothetical protein